MRAVTREPQSATAASTLSMRTQHGGAVDLQDYYRRTRASDLTGACSHSALTVDNENSTYFTHRES